MNQLVTAGTRGRHWPCIAALGLALAAGGLAASEPDWQRLLERPVLARHVPEREVLAYCAPRVVPLPEFTDRAAWETYASELRSKVLEEIVFQGEGTRWREAPTNIQWLDELPGGAKYRVRRLRYEALPGLWIPALLYEPRELSGRVPVILNVNGHDANGKAADYKQRRCIHLAQNGMLALNVEWLGMGELRTSGFQHGRMNQLDLCGTSGMAVFFLNMRRGLDLLLEHPHADAGRVAVAGMSGGGWQTILLGSLDTRVTLSNPVAGYSDFTTRIQLNTDLGDSEQTPVDMAALADYTHLTALLAPRGALLTYNQRDECCFASDHALPPLLASARPIYDLFGAAERLTSHVNADPGTHNFELDNRQALYRAIQRQFFADDSAFSTDEQVRDEEVLSGEQLRVGVPEQQLDFTRLARGLAADLPRDARWPSVDGWHDWRAERAEILRRTVRLPDPEPVVGRRVAADRGGDVEVIYWKLAIGDSWTLPVVEFSPPHPQGTVVVVGDQGRASLAPQVGRWLAKGHRVVAVDPFYWGESALERRAYLFALLVSSVGERPLGVQAGQLASVVRWLEQREAEGPIGISAIGQRATLAALVAGAFEAKGNEPVADPAPSDAAELDANASPASANQATVAFLELDGLMSSLREILEQDLAVEQAPELFCFGLLRDFDIRQLVAMQPSGDVRLGNASSRLVEELAEVDRLWKAMGQRITRLESQTPAEKSE